MTIRREFLPRFAKEYGLPLDQMLELSHAAAATSPPFDERAGRRSNGMLLYPVKGTLEDMLAYGRTANLLHLETRDRLGNASYADFLRLFPRDSALELLCAHRLLCAGESALQRVRPLQHLGWRFPMVESDRDVYAGHRKHYAIKLTDGEMRLTAVPQVTLLTRKIDHTARPDFLVELQLERMKGFVDLEVDGNHENQKERDQQRAVGLGLVRVKLTRENLLSPDFDRELWSRLRGVLRWLQERRSA